MVDSETVALIACACGAARERFPQLPSQTVAALEKAVSSK
jgi:hypothetical protein